MKQVQKKVCCIGLSLLLLCFYLIQPAAADAQQGKAACDQVLSYLSGVSEQETPGDWEIFTLARGGTLTDTAKAAYFAALEQRLEEKKGILSKNRSTEYTRTILALSSVGVDASNVYGYSLLEPLSNYDYVVTQGIYGGIYALLALDSRGYEIPTVPQGYTQNTREKLVSYLLSKQLEDGGFAFSGRYAEPDTTSIVISALTPYSQTIDGVQAAIEKAVAKLSQMMGEDGSYKSYGAVNSESTAQVLTALSVAHISVEDSRFQKENGNPLTALLTFQLADGSFCHIKDGGSNRMATQQAAYALVAYTRDQENAASLYSMSEVAQDTTLQQDKKELNVQELFGPAAGEEEKNPADDGNEKETEQQTPETTEAKKEEASTEQITTVQVIEPSSVKQPEKEEKQKTTMKKPFPKKNIVLKKEKRKQAKKQSVATISVKNKVSHLQKKQKTSFFQKKQKKKKVSLYQAVSEKKMQEFAWLSDTYDGFHVTKKHTFPCSIRVKTALPDGDYVLCQYFGTEDKVAALAKVTVKNGTCQVVVEEAGDYFFADKVRNSTVAQEQSKQQKVVTTVKEEQSQKKKETGKEHKTEKQERIFFTALLLLIVIGVFVWRGKRRS